MAGDKFKPQYKRLLFIDKMIRAGKYPSCASLAAEWEVSAKTIQRDIDYLKYEMDAPIEYDKSRHGIYYNDKTWFLPAVLLSEGDILALLVGTHALEMYKGTPVAEELKSIYTRLAQLLPDKISMAPELIFNRFSFYGAPARPISADIWKTLIRAVLTQRVLHMDYASPRSKDPKQHTIHPLHLANIEGDWYVLAFETRWEDIAQFAVSRIMKAELKDEAFTMPKGFDAQRMMNDRFGKFVHASEGTKIAVRLLFKAKIAASIAEKTWHPEQELKWHRDGQLELAFPVRDLRDIMPWLLSHGSAVRPLAPQKLRAMVNAELEKMLAAR